MWIIAKSSENYLIFKEEFIINYYEKKLLYNVDNETEYLYWLDTNAREAN